MGSIEASPSRFAWHQSLQGRWERDIDECEEFYRSSARKAAGYFPVTGCAVLEIPASLGAAAAKERHHIEEALRTAWANLRHNHPTLGSRLELAADSNQWKRVYASFKDSDEEEGWLDATFHVVEYDGDALEWFNNNPPSFETSTLFLVKSSVTKDQKTPFQYNIFVQCPHDVTDGVGVLHLIHQLLEHAAVAHDQDAALPSTQRNWDGEHSKLSPSVRIAARIPEVLSESQTQQLEEIQARNGTIYNHPALLSLPSSGTKSATDRTQRVALRVEKSATSQILSKCKAIAPGISVTHVFMAALALALAEVQPKKAAPYPARYVNHSMINLRPFCSPPYNGPEHVAAPYHTISAQAVGIDVMVGEPIATKQERNSSQLPKLAAHVRDFYKNVRPVISDEIHEQICFTPSTFESFTTPAGSDPHAVSDPPFCPVALSSIGNISSFVAPMYGPFEVKSVWAASEPLGAGVALFLGTWEGELSLSGVFDTQLHDSSYINDFLGRILDVVYEGLGIDEQVLKSQTSSEKKRSYESDEVREEQGERPARRLNTAPRSPFE